MKCCLINIYGSAEGFIVSVDESASRCLSSHVFMPIKCINVGQSQHSQWRKQKSWKSSSLLLKIQNVYAIILPFSRSEIANQTPRKHILHHIFPVAQVNFLSCVVLCHSCRVGFLSTLWSYVETARFCFRKGFKPDRVTIVVSRVWFRNFYLISWVRIMLLTYFYIAIVWRGASV